jgi:hypothetical protein
LISASVSDIDMGRLKGNIMSVRALRSIFTALLVSALPAVAATLYVNLNNPTPAPPYSSWASAATNIQDAVDAATDGDTVLVTNGVYHTGGRVVYGSLTNRVAVTKALRLQSVNGPAVTLIRGYQVPGTVYGDSAVRCVYLTNGAVLAGFTLTNGATRKTGDWDKAQSGGGAWCETDGVMVSNCVFAVNTARECGGGIRSGTLNGCVLYGNLAGNGGGAYDSTLVDCRLTNNLAGLNGGGVDGGSFPLKTLVSCVLSSNWAGESGGGSSFCNLSNCTLIGNSARSWYGGGAAEGTLIECTLIANSCGYQGGGAESSTLINCVLTGNSAISGGGASGCTFISCSLTGNSALVGGGSYQSTMDNCTLAGNWATNSGGGTEASTLNSCLVVSNLAIRDGMGDGGGAGYSSRLKNCTLIGNSATRYGGGAYQCTLNNCIAYFNTAPGGSNHAVYAVSINYSCTTPLPSSGSGNITNAPLLLDAAAGDFRLQLDSPCINAGKNSYVTNSTDLDGNPRIAGGTVDMGAYEFQNPASLISYAWLQQYGLPTDGSADGADTDKDQMNNWQEWRAGTIPIDPLSLLKMLSVSNSAPSLVVTWQSASGVNYFLERAADLRGAVPYPILQSNLVGQAGTTSFTDLTATNGGPYFYRVGVQ